MTFSIFPIVLHLQLQWAHEVILYGQNKSTSLNSKYNITFNFWHTWIIVEQLHESIHYNHLMYNLIYIRRYLLNLKNIVNRISWISLLRMRIYNILYLLFSKRSIPPLWILRVWLVDMYLSRLPMLLESELVHRKSAVVSSLHNS